MKQKKCLLSGAHSRKNLSRRGRGGWILGTILSLASALPISPAVAGEAEFTSIFDGETLAGWVGNEDLWTVEDGVIVGETTRRGQIETNSFLIWTEKEPADFELRFRYRIITDWANSGIQIRSRWLNDIGDGFVLAGYQPDIATDDWITGIHYEERGRGILARRGQRTVIGEDGKRETSRFAEETELKIAFNQSHWTRYHVIAQGDTIITKINDVKMHEIVDLSSEARRSGYIGFQIHTGPAMRIELTDIELKGGSK